MRRPSPRPPRRRAGSRLAVGAVFAAAGLLFATSAVTSGGDDLRSDTQDLGALVRERSRAVEDGSAQVARLRAEVERLSAGAGAAPAGEALTDPLADPALGAASGALPVEGPGVAVVLDDAPTTVPRPAGAAPDDLVVHQQDVEAVVNALWSAGAEAVQVMDQRLVSTSAVRCVGSVLVLQGRTYSPPYRIAAIGDPAALSAALETSPAVAVYRQYVAAYGLGYEVSTDGALRFEAYDGPLGLEHARATA
ncbi:DUF881 domain-containing protein [Kineococcus terrestris]|uniref:DUF881 domain-containing protein n=1 Tax=Kineococcus terrestris TaxID=2044856 RepID=UPI0034DB0B83